jgi:hypothetical protein
MSALRKILQIIGVAALFLLLGWWAITGLGVAEIIGQLLWQSVTGWYRFSGFRRWYLLGGAITVLIITVVYGVQAIIALVRDFANNWINIIIAVVVLGCIPIIAIPLITGGWPFVLWLFIANRVEKRRKSSRVAIE